MGQLAEVLKLKIENKGNIIAFKCKGEALRSVLLYAQKYREEFENLIQCFSQEIWNICSESTDDNKFDKVNFKLKE